MVNLLDSEGNSLKINNIYEDNSLEDTEFKWQSICFIESYKMGENPWDEEVILCYESGLFRNLDSAENLRLIGRKNERGDVTFENIRNYALKPSTQKEKMEKYGTTNLDKILANLSAQENERLKKRAERDLPGLIQKRKRGY